MTFKNQSRFTKEGSWYKGNLHSHSTNSDGLLKPEEAAALYKAHGYHFLALSEHDLYTDYRSKLNSESFIMLPAIEASAVLYDGEDKAERLKVHHIHGILGSSKMQKEAADGLFEHREYVKPPVFYGTWDGEETARQIADNLRRHGCITIYNHPVWSRTEHREFIHTEGLFGIEIFNYNTVNESGTGYDTTGWDAMLLEGRKIHALASDDNHNEGLFDDTFGGYIMVKAKELTHDNIIDSLLAGNYYSSSGPEIYDWGIKGQRVYIKCSPVNRVNFMCGNAVGAGAAVMCRDIEDTMDYAEFTLRGNESYVRIECIDRYGRTAWTNALWGGE